LDLDGSDDGRDSDSKDDSDDAGDRNIGRKSVSEAKLKVRLSSFVYWVIITKIPGVAI